MQVFFTAGGALREHAVYLLAEVELRAPVLQPPGMRIFEVSAKTGEGMAEWLAFLEAQLAGIAAVKPGTTAGAVDHAARQVLQRAELDRFVAEQVRSAEVVGLDPAIVPASLAALDDYYARVRPGLRATPEAKLALRGSFTPRLYFETKGDVFENRHVTEQRIVLKDESDFFTPYFSQCGIIQRNCGNAVEMHFAGRWKVHRSGQIEHCRFAAAAAADQRHKFASLDLQRHPDKRSRGLAV